MKMKGRIRSLRAFISSVLIVPIILNMPTFSAGITNVTQNMSSKKLRCPSDFKGSSATGNKSMKSVNKYVANNNG